MVTKHFLNQFVVRLNLNNPAVIDLLSSKLLEIGYQKFPHNFKADFGKYMCGNIHIGNHFYDIANGFFCYYYDVIEIVNTLDIPILDIEKDFNEILKIAKQFKSIYEPFMIGNY